MSETKQPQNDPVVTIQLKASELFQIHLSVVCRSAMATAKWTNATSPDEQNVLQSEIQYLTTLTEKIQGELNNVEKK